MWYYAKKSCICEDTNIYAYNSHDIMLGDALLKAKLNKAIVVERSNPRAPEKGCSHVFILAKEGTNMGIFGSLVNKLSKGFDKVDVSGVSDVGGYVGYIENTPYKCTIYGNNDFAVCGDIKFDRAYELFAKDMLKSKSKTFYE